MVNLKDILKLDLGRYYLVEILRPISGLFAILGIVLGLLLFAFKIFQGLGVTLILFGLLNGLFCWLGVFDKKG